MVIIVGHVTLIAGACQLLLDLLSLPLLFPNRMLADEAFGENEAIRIHKNALRFDFDAEIGWLCYLSDFLIFFRSLIFFSYVWNEQLLVFSSFHHSSSC